MTFFLANGVSKRVTRLLILYLRGISSGDFQKALSGLLSQDAPNLSPSVIGRLKEEWAADYERWRKSDLSARRYVSTAYISRRE